MALASVANDPLPDAPQPQNDPQSASTTGQASISGTVQDTTKAIVAGAQVSLTRKDGKTLETVTSGANGEFAFTNLVAGSYLVVVTAKGFAPYTSGDISVSEQQFYMIPDISLSVGSAITEVTVRPTEVIAAEQIKQEEKQRLLGIVPNFYVSYEKNAAPMTSRQKLSLAAHDTLDWTSFVGITATAGIEQANNSYAGYGQGAAGYAKRWAAKFGDGRSSDFLDHYVFASLFHQDPRYFYQGTGTNKSRLIHAVSSAFVARSDSGKTMPNYSYLLGTMVSGALSNAYYPHADRGANLVFTSAAVGIAGRAGAAVLQEFLGRKVTKNAPKSVPPGPAPPYIP
ncbi:carboxypeptidase-like regulatory domain-containing protein [Silvibacterium acidisoli]|uniref:carboxypeptidase-like regulatory domain-containing protein n=1 Tax=Acidobacteriaceae bacterium ZG23-2 TaxID=2883246 RepID=UPI00406C544C